MKQLDVIALIDDIPEHRLRRGDIGTVMFVHSSGQDYEVEFATLSGDSLAVLTVPQSAIRPVGRDEIAHARRVA